MRGSLGSLGSPRGRGSSKGVPAGRVDGTSSARRRAKVLPDRYLSGFEWSAVTALLARKVRNRTRWPASYPTGSSIFHLPEEVSTDTGPDMAASSAIRSYRPVAASSMERTSTSMGEDVTTWAISPRHNAAKPSASPFVAKIYRRHVAAAIHFRPCRENARRAWSCTTCVRFNSSSTGRSSSPRSIALSHSLKALSLFAIATASAVSSLTHSIQPRANGEGAATWGLCHLSPRRR
jgi:hypothetical protein